MTKRIPGRLFLWNLYTRRNLLYQLVRRDFERRFIGSAAGWLWGLIHPLVLLLSWTFVFQMCFKVELPPGEVTQNYTFYLFCGYLPWMLFQETVQRSSTSLLEQANLITKTVFPSEMVPVSIFCSTLVSHLMTLGLVMLTLVLWKGEVSAMVVLLPVYMALTGLFAVGIGWIVASLQVYLRDTAQMLQVILTLWFWVTPLFITIDQIPEGFRFLIRANPLAYLVRAYRERLLSYRPPDLEELALLAAWSAGAFIIGGLFFRQLKPGFADVL